MEKDNNDNYYENIGNIRVTYKNRESRETEKDWSETDVLSFRAYRNSETDSLHMGAELKLESKETIIELIEVLCRLYKIAP